MHSLKAELVCGSSIHRATVKRGELGAILCTQQLINGQYHTAGQWYVSTLLQKLSDAIYIDYGQNWKIDSGLRAATLEACEFLAGEHKE